MNKRNIFLVSFVVLALLGGFIISQFLTNNESYRFTGPMMGQANNSFSYISETDAEKLMKTSLAQAKIDKVNNTITYQTKNIEIVMYGGPEEADGKFVIKHLINPTIRIPKGANVKLTFINADEGMPHGIEITSSTPPYSYMSMMNGGIYLDAFITPIPEYNGNKMPIASTSFTANNNGDYYYICQYPGHAANGMYGKFIIE